MPTLRESSAPDVRAFADSRNARVLTFVGYSGAEYEDAAVMLAQAKQVLAAHDPAHTLVNIGATTPGIGAVYGLAKRLGFGTMGIVSTLARDEAVPLSPDVDAVFFVRDETWGGRLPGSDELSPTSAAIVAVSDEMVGIGGGEIARDEMRAAQAAGKRVTFFAAEMNHALAREKARNAGHAETVAPAAFRGAAEAWWFGEGQR